MEQRNALDTLKAEHDDALRIYPELLDPAREPQPDDAAKLRSIMAVLDLTANQVQQHDKARRDAARLDELQPEIDKADAKRDELSRELIAEHETFRAAERSYQNRHNRLSLEINTLEQTVNRLQRDQERIHDLRRRFPLAFGANE